ncbi:hypothetical protein CPB83DRAFT_909180 [Crepidotus variabilis]|uniref:F-box domain-containing protein n=1 Tax=Crepidotus variabilis TaxID=179855 RepID=A0A9P6JM15_9AGAR|nr:hypothetical protein CPB83DRAFT_909180 [Crepidotus variabilis]
MSALGELPNELLSLIFEHLYSANTVEDDGLRWEDENLHNPNLFPWAIYQVCPLWAQIATQYPHFWTRISFDVASSESLPLVAFEWSKGNSFKVLIYSSRRLEDSIGSQTSKNTSFTRSSQALLEKNRVASITNALLPHLGRCEHMEYDVNIASSLPRLPIFLQKTANQIRTLKLCGRDSNLSEWDAHFSYPSFSSTSFRSVREISLPVATFISVGRNDPRQLWDLSECTHVELYHYEFNGLTSTARVGVASMGEFFAHLVSLYEVTHIKLRGLSVQSQSIGALPKVQSPDDLDSPPWPWHLISFSFKDLSQMFFEGLVNAFSIHAESGEIDNCDFPYNAWWIDALDLILINIPIRAQFRAALKNFSGPILQFKSCPGLNDDVLSFLGSEECYDLRQLRVSDCSGYSIRSLKDLVSKRRARVVEDNGRYWDVWAIYLEGSSSKPNLADAEWFLTNLQEFSVVE